jgi:hypothetical protein
MVTQGRLQLIQREANLDRCEVAGGLSAASEN